MNTYRSYIYLDSKILGTAKQIAVFFECGIFRKEDTVILIKKYKHKSANQLAKIFENHNLNFRFVSAADLDNLPNGVIFYPFNAQSNVRAVANRKLTHIFITHGESNKAASVKPIIRVYDHVTTAGQAGIDRFLNHGIFSEHDIADGRLVKMGDTFIGKTGMSSPSKNSIPCIFYAPTWEGGIEQENYSSLSHTKLLAHSLATLCDKHSIKQIVIQPHPNTGHRLKIYKQYLLDLISILSQQGIDVALYKKLHLNFWQSRKLKKNNIALINTLSSFHALEGICDISAIETQFLNEDIPYHLFWDIKQHPQTLFSANHYRMSNLSTGTQTQYFWEINTDLMDLDTFKNYVIDKEMSAIPLEKKIDTLLNKTKQ